MTSDSGLSLENLRAEQTARDQIKRDTDALDRWRADRAREAELGKHGLQQFNQIIELFAPGSGIK